MWRVTEGTRTVLILQKCTAIAVERADECGGDRAVNKIASNRKRTSAVYGRLNLLHQYYANYFNFLPLYGQGSALPLADPLPSQSVIILARGILNHQRLIKYLAPPYYEVFVVNLMNVS